MKKKQTRIKYVTQAPPFDGDWDFVVINPAHENPDQDYYTCSANHDSNPGTGDGFGYQDGRNQGFFRAGPGDVNVPDDAPVGWWAYQHNYSLNIFGKHFRATFDVLDIIFDNALGLEVGGTVAIWASIMQCRIVDGVSINEYPVLHAAVVPVAVSHKGEVDVFLKAKTASELNITNPSEEYAFRIGWIVQIRYQSRQSAQIELNSYFRNFSTSRRLVIDPTEEIGEIEGPIEEYPGKIKRAATSLPTLPEGFIKKGR